MRKSSLAVAAVGGLATVGFIGAPAQAATPVNPGHHDIVNVQCTDGSYQFLTNVNGANHAAEDLADFEFTFPESVSPNNKVTWASGEWSVNAAGTGPAIADVGINYSASGTGCAPSITIEITNPEVEFNNQNTITLPAGGHQHGTWTFDSATKAQWDDYVGFEVTAGSAVELYGDARFVVG